MTYKEANKLSQALKKAFDIAMGSVIKYQNGDYAIYVQSPEGHTATIKCPDDADSIVHWKKKE